MGRSEEELHPIRVWKNLDTRDVKKHLLLIEDLYGVCANCKQMGLNYTKDAVCNNCGTTFKYVATRLKDPGAVHNILRRIQKDSLPLTMIDREDYEKSMAKNLLGDIFSS